MTEPNGVHKVVVLGTGGTIAGASALPGDDRHYRAGQIGVDQLLQHLPKLPASVVLVAEQVAQVDSKDMAPALWLQLGRRVAHWLAQADVAGVVITHGTDTLEETAYFLHATLPASAKPVVLTCAMRPATSLAPDGPQNLRDAVTVALHPGAQGVLAVCAGTLHGALDVQKLHTSRLDAFSSGDAGVLGKICGHRLFLMRNWPQALVKPCDLAIENIAPDADWPQVDIVTSHAGADGRVVDALVAQGVRGIVVAGTGNGTVHQVLETALLRAQALGVVVWRSTRCALGPVSPRPDAALPDAAGLSPVKARIALALELLACSPR